MTVCSAAKSFLSSSYIKSVVPQPYASPFLNSILNTEYIGIGQLKHDERRGNAENQFKARLLAIEDKFYTSDLEIIRARFLADIIEHNRPKEEIMKTAEIAGCYADVINENTTLAASARTLKGIVS